MATNLNKAFFHNIIMIELSYTKKQYSDKEFLKLMDRRVKQRARGINPNEKIVLEASDRDFKLVKELLKRVFKDPEIESGESDIKALSFEEEATLAINDLQSGKRPKKLKNLLGRITEEEIAHLCRIFKINNEEPEIHLFLKNMLNKHPDIAFGFIQALEKIK